MSNNKKHASRAEQKSKGREQKKKKSLVESDGTRTTWETVRWIGGLFLLLFSVYTLVASVSHLFNYSDVSKFGIEGAAYGNVCGRLGALVAHGLTGKSF